MKKCFKCGQVIPFNENKCPYCGTTVKSVEFCPNCNARLEDNPDYCSNCGEKLYTICSGCRKKIPGSPKKCPYCETLLR